MSAVYSVSSLADHWSCGPDTIRSLIKSGDLPAFKLGGKLLRIRADEVERFECRSIASNDTVEPSPSSGTKRDDATDIRLERLIEHRPKPPRARSGSDAR